VDATVDDLLKPLGAEPPRRRVLLPRLPMTRILAGGLAVFAGGVSGFIAIVDYPLGGEPHALVPIESAPVRPPREAEPAIGAGPQASAAEVETASGVAVIRPDGMNAPESIVIRVPGPEDGRLAPAPDPRLVERTRHGLLPRIAPDGSTPSAGLCPAGRRAAPAARPRRRASLSW
jgi:hypothetical protein